MTAAPASVTNKRRSGPRTRHLIWTASFLALGALSACAGGDSADTPTSPTPPTTPPVAPAPVEPGIVMVTLAGLPGDLPASVTITGPQPGSTFSRTATGQVVWTDLPAGRYSVAVNSVRGTLGLFSGSPATFDIDVPAGGPTTNVLAQYRPTPSAVAVEITGLPDSSGTGVKIKSPGNIETAIKQSQIITAAQLAVGQLTPDSWQITTDTVNIAGTRYEPSRLGVDTTLAFGDTLHFKVNFKLATGSLALAVTGLPVGVAGNITLAKPNGQTQPLTATKTLTGLNPGRYTLIAAPVVHQGVSYLPHPDTLKIDVEASLVAAPATISYAAQVGQLDVTIAGAPEGSTPSLTLNGNGPGYGLTRKFTHSETVDSLPVGSYTLVADPLTNLGDLYAPTPATQMVNVTTGQRAAATVTFALTSGSLAITVDGLPDGTQANVEIAGPGNYSRSITGTTTLKGLTPGQYTITGRKVGQGSNYYAASPGTKTVDVQKGLTPSSASVSYSLVPTTLNIAVTGLPSGTNAALSLTGPVGEHYSLTASQRLSPASPGRWRLTASPVTTGAGTYNPTPASIDSVLEAGGSLDYSVHYSLGTGSLALAITGLPSGTAGSVQVTGPNGFSRAATGTVTYASLTPGTYTVTAASVTKGSTNYTPTPATQSVTVAASATAAPATVNYTADNNGGGGGGGGGGLNLKIEAVHLTQAVQSLHGAAPLVAGRDALLRVFVTATQANTERPSVRVRLYNGATLIHTENIPAPETSVRTSINEGLLNSTWNMLVSSGQMTSNLKVQVDLDPGETSGDTYRADNTWPSGGLPQAISVYNAPTFNVRFVPVTTGALTGNVNSGNAGQFTNLASQLWPLKSIATSVRAPFTSSATELQSDGTGWYTLISEINALRTTDGAAATTHYYGVVKVSYSSGVAGLGYVPGRTAIGWDYLPSGDEVAAHEWGHNFSLPHAPCGGVAGPDPSYPYPGGLIGQWGWNANSNSLVSPSATDLMGYCNNIWVSDYNWTKVLNYRNTSCYMASRAAASIRPSEGLLIWGRISNGTIHLEPAFRVTAPVTTSATSAATAPTHRLDLLDAAGQSLFTLPIETSLIDHPQAGEERSFSVVVPWTQALESSLASIRLSDNRLPTRAAIRQSNRARGLPGVQQPPRARVVADDDPEATLTRTARQVRVGWGNRAFEMAMVRDASSGEIMGFVRQSGAVVNTAGRQIEVVFSDGTRSAVRR